MSFTLMLIGPAGVGRSALAIQMASHRFFEAYDPTIEDCHRKQVAVDDEVCTLSILDTAGREEFSAMRDLYITQTEGFICVYDITSKSSFEKLDAFREQILRVKDLDRVPMVIVGNKSDLENDRAVPTSQGQAYADRHGLPFLETSAKTGANVEEPFFSLVRQLRKAARDRPVRTHTSVKK